MTNNLFSDKITSYCVLDTETTGLDPNSCELLEIGIIKIVNGIKVGEFHSYVKPSKKIPVEITAINGITDKDVKDAPSSRDAIILARQFIGSMLVVGQNIKFDI